MFRLFYVMAFVSCAAVCVAQSPPPSPPPIAPMSPPPANSIDIDQLVVKKAYTSLMEICEELPRKPELGDNKLAAIPDNEWLGTNLRSCSLQVTGKVVGFSQVIQRSGQPGQTKTVVHVSLDRGEEWRRYDFTCRISAACDATTNDLSKLHLGDEVTMKGIIARMAIEWECEGPAARGHITLQLTDCKLVAGSEGAIAESKPATTVEPSNAKVANATTKKPDVLMEIVPTSASDMEIRRLRVPGGWLVFMKWHIAWTPRTPDHSDTMCVFYPDPGHGWEIPIRGNVAEKTSSEQQITPALPLRPLGRNFMVDKNNIIWEQGRPIGIYGIDGVMQSERRDRIEMKKPVQDR